jgi:hypothetical protein
MFVSLIRYLPLHAGFQSNSSFDYIPQPVLYTWNGPCLSPPPSSFIITIYILLLFSIYFYLYVYMYICGFAQQSYVCWLIPTIWNLKSNHRLLGLLLIWARGLAACARSATRFKHSSVTCGAGINEFQGIYWHISSHGFVLHSCSEKAQQIYYK